MLERNKPVSVDAITAVSGQWIGMRIQASRWLMALSHEILHAIAQAQETRVLARARIRKAVTIMPPGFAKRWKNLVNVSRGRAKATGPLRGYLRDIRNQSVFRMTTRHIWHMRIARSLRLTKSRSNRRASSVGQTMNKTRFFFADAAASRMFCGQDDLEALFKESSDLVNELHHTLAVFVLAYLKSGRNGERQTRISMARSSKPIHVKKICGCTRNGKSARTVVCRLVGKAKRSARRVRFAARPPAELAPLSWPEPVDFADAGPRPDVRLWRGRMAGTRANSSRRCTDARQGARNLRRRLAGPRCQSIDARRSPGSR